MLPGGPGPNAVASHLPGLHVNASYRVEGPIYFGGCNGSVPSEPVVLNATATGGAPPYNFSWYFVYGSPPVTGNPVYHTFHNGGSDWVDQENVTLNVTDSAGTWLLDQVHIAGVYGPAPECVAPSQGFPVLVVGAVLAVVALVIGVLEARDRSGRNRTDPPREGKEDGPKGEPRGEPRGEPGKRSEGTPSP